MRRAPDQNTITAVEIAKRHRLTAKQLRSALRKEGFRWHSRGARWTVLQDSPEHEAIEQVAQRLSGSQD